MMMYKMMSKNQWVKERGLNKRGGDVEKIGSRMKMSMIEPSENSVMMKTYA